MSTRNLLLKVAVAALLLASTATADLSSRRIRPFRPVVSPRIVHVEAADGRLTILGESLPTGRGVAVLLGGQSLRVLSSDRSKLIAVLPSQPPAGTDELVVTRGARRAVVRGRSIEWGLRWSAPRADRSDPPAPERTTTAQRSEDDARDDSDSDKAVSISEDAPGSNSLAAP